MTGVRRLSVFLLLLLSVLASCAEHVKEPAVAGSFYPSDEKMLRDMVRSFIASAQPPASEGRLIALISPHAGYQYSGQVAAYSYKHLQGRDIRTVVIIGPAHHKAFNGISVYAKGSMKTPLGNVKIDEALAKSLLNDEAGVVFDAEAYEKEHSIEVQLPFLQVVLKDFMIVPLLVGSPTRESFGRVTQMLVDLMSRDDKVMLIASTDLSHYRNYPTAVAMDKKTIEAVERLSIEDLEAYFATGQCEMCGGNPVLLTLAVTRALGGTNGLLYKYANTGDVTGDMNRVVGYSAIGLYQSPLTREEKEFLLSLATRTINEYVTSGKVPNVEVTNPKLAANGSSFVTINRHGNLRGCIGNMQASMPLYKSVIMNAIAASTKDHRFSPMTREELADMEVEVSVLTPFEPLYSLDRIEIGKHGLYLVSGKHSSVFLPQVPVEFGWDLQTYLAKLAEKAGLPEDGWKGGSLFTFTAEVIK